MVNWADAQFVQQGVLAAMHAPGLVGSLIVVAADVQQTMDRVKQDLGG